jgi:hypothetical protein
MTETGRAAVLIAPRTDFEVRELPLPAPEPGAILSAFAGWARARLPIFTAAFADYYYLGPGHFVFKAPDELSDATLAPLNCAICEVAFGLKQAKLRNGLCNAFWRLQAVRARS